MSEFKTSAFRTKTIFNERNNRSLQKYWPIAIDLGYSSVKAISPNWISQFPSFAVETNSPERYGDLDTSDILYQDLDTGKYWLVGKDAQNSISSRSTNASDGVLFGRDRYYDDMFLVLIRTGLGASLRWNSQGDPKGKRIKIMTGLPPAYQDEDSPRLREAFCGHHHFSLTFGRKEPVEFEFDLSEDDILIVSQPFGSLWSIAYDNSGRPAENCNNYLSKNVLIFDPGYCTLDLHSLKNHQLGRYDTFDNLGMKQVHKNTIDRIFREYNVRCTLTSFQQYLETGEFKVTVDRIHTKKYPFSEILQEESKKVCLAAINKTFDAFPIADYDYLVVTGGASAAWYDIIKDTLKDTEGLEIIKGNINDPSLPLTFANVRGYYLFLFVSLLRKG